MRERGLLGSKGELLSSSKKGEDWILRGTLDLFEGQKSLKKNFSRFPPADKGREKN